MAKVPLPPQKFLRECYDYDPDTGLFHWRCRPDHHFENALIARTWNRRHAGSRVFCSVDKDGYYRAEVSYLGRRHRVRAALVAYKIMTNEEPEMVDHRDLDPGNDRFKNLRAATRFQNRFNAPGVRTHPLPKGVHFEKGRFRAMGAHKGRKCRLGTFSSPAEAHAAYCAWARPIHGEFFNAGPDKPSVFD